MFRTSSRVRKGVDCSFIMQDEVWESIGADAKEERERTEFMERVYAVVQDTDTVGWKALVSSTISSPTFLRFLNIAASPKR